LVRIRVVLEYRERLLQARHVVRCGIDQKVDVLGRAQAAVQDDGEASDQDVPGSRIREGSADPADVFDRRRANLRDVSLVSHSSACAPGFRPESVCPLTERPELRAERD
jgi:hypothetical protein